MPITYVLLGAWGAILSMPVGWVLGVRVGDTRGIIGYAAGALALATGVSAAIGW